MNILLPYPNLVASAIVLDNASLMAQRIDGLEILHNLRLGRVAPSRNESWLVHPQVRACVGFDSFVALAVSVLGREMLRRNLQTVVAFAFDADGRLNEQFTASGGPLPDQASDETVPLPPWLGGAEFHSHCRARLLSRDRGWYGEFGWTEQASDEEWSW